MSEEEKLEKQLNEMVENAGYRMAIVAVSKSGVNLPLTDVMVEGFRPSLMLVKTKAKQDDADA